MYLELDVFEFETSKGAKSMKFKLLNWWFVNQTKYKVWPCMTTKILAISISIVASESTFSANGRVIDLYRVFLAPKTASILICGGDWIQAKHQVKKTNAGMTLTL